MSRKSGKQRRDEILRKRLERAQRLQQHLRRPDVRWADAGIKPEPGMIEADREILARHNNTYGTLPGYYVDLPFVCRDCGEQHVWTARQQKWWYEVAHGHIDSVAVRCLSCRRARRTANRMAGADRLGELCDRLRALGRCPPDSAAREEVERALADKWWGVRIVAIGVFGAWGDAQSVNRLKTLIAEHAGSKDWGDWNAEARNAAFKALGQCLPASETAWGLDAYLSRSEAWPLRIPLAKQTSDVWDPIVAAEWRRNEPPRLYRLCWLLSETNVGGARHRQWRERFLSHSDPTLRRSAEYLWRQWAPKPK